MHTTTAQDGTSTPVPTPVMRDVGDLNEAHARLALLQLADSAFPIGLFAFSHGLETLIQDGAIRSVDSLEAHVRDWVGWVVGPGDAVFVAAAYRSGSVGDLDTLLRSEEHTSELQSHLNLVCRLLLEK